MQKYQLIIIGGGSAGFAGATRANDDEIKTALINDGPLGGTCVNIGCVPSKYLLEATNFYTHAEKPVFDGISIDDIRLDFRKMMAEKNELVEKLRLSNYRSVLEYMPHVRLYEGRAILVGKNRVKVNDDILESDKILLSIGAKPHVPAFTGIENLNYLTSDDMLELKEPPKSLIVIGGRAVALEFAQIFYRSGSNVTILQRSERILPQQEPEISEKLAEYLREEGVKIHTDVRIERFYQEHDVMGVEVSVGGQPMRFEASEIMIATGRKPRLDDLGLETVEVEVENGFIKVDEYCRTSNPGIYAAGDCTGSFQLETLAAKMGNYAVRNAFHGANLTINVKEIPSVVFTDPQAAMVGYTEEEFSELMGYCSCRSVEMYLVPKAQIIKDTRGLVKIGMDYKTKKIVGGQILAHNAAELIHELTLAVKFGLTIDVIIETSHVFPTLSEGIKKACQAFYRDVSTMSCCIE
jgi:mercuric reductase